MFKTVSSALAIAALTFGTFAPAPALALNEDQIGKLLFGLVAVAAINRIAQDRRSEQADTQHQGREDRNTGDWQQHRMTLPAACLQTVETSYGDHPLFGQRCLERNFAYASRLPARCEVRLYTDNGPRSGYDPHCLRDSGFHSVRRR